MKTITSSQVIKTLAAAGLGRPAVARDSGADGLLLVAGGILQFVSPSYPSFAFYRRLLTGKHWELEN